MGVGVFVLSLEALVKKRRRKQDVLPKTYGPSKPIKGLEDPRNLMK